jgi:hypothetical protein
VQKNRSIKPKIRWKAKGLPDVWQGQHQVLEVQQALILPILQTLQLCQGRAAFLLQVFCDCTDRLLAQRHQQFRADKKYSKDCTESGS